MFKNYLKITLRNALKHKAYSMINIAGLAVGLACCLLIALYLSNELSYDRFHTNADRIYQLVNDVQFPAGETKSAYTSAFPGPTMAEAFPEIASMVRLVAARSSFMLTRDGQTFEERSLLFADSSVFEIFSFPLRLGNPQTALRNPFSMVLTESTARKYFGDSEPLGQVLSANDGHSYTVTGILAELPATSHLQFDGLVSMTTARDLSMFYFQDRLDLRFATYFLLHDGTEKSELEAKFPAYIEQLIGELQRENNFFYTFSLVPLTAVYLHAEHRGLGANGSLPNLVIFSAIALFTLAIACINFMNLATARSTTRAREVGVRKAVGADRTQLAWQFLAESMLMSLTALAASILVAWLLLPVFNSLAGTSLQIATLLRPARLLIMLASGIVVGVLAGSYPALVLSGFHPIAILRGRFQASKQGVSLRKGLVVFQFAISITLIAGTTIVYSQLRFMQQQDPGFRTEQMLIVDFKSDTQIRQQIEAVKMTLRNTPGVIGASASWMVPGAGRPEALARVETADGSRCEVMMPVYPVDFDFLALYDLEILAGRSFSPDFATDGREAFIVNEAAAYALGYTSPQEIVGKSLFEWGHEGRIIGVVKDFHYTSLREQIKPMNFLIGTQPRFLTLRLAAGDLQRTLEEIEQTWRQIAPHRPFDFRFLDAAFDAQYKADARFGKIVGSFAIFAILIACLGLLGLAAFSAEQRTKEIGVRKVLGASVNSIIVLLSSDFTKLILLAFVIASPIAWFAMSRWLQDFAYRIEIGWWVYLLAGGLAFLIALATVSTQAIKAALANPVDSLRYE